MALIIEDGMQPLNANTYASVSDLGSYAALRGLSLPGSTSQQEHLLIRAMDWLEAQSHHRMLFEFIKHALVQTSFVFEDRIT